MWRLARLTTQEGTEIDELIALALANVADQAAAGLATAPKITAAQLQEIRGDLADPRNAMTFEVDMEKYLSLDSVMMCIRGEGAKVLDPAAIFNPGETVDEGDLAKADWDVLLRALNGAAAEYGDIEKLPTYAQRQAAYAKREPAFEEAKAPLGVVAEGSSRPEVGKAAVEAFLKMGPKESREAYSRRLAMLFGPDPAVGARVDKLVEREHVYRRLAEIAVDMADYRLAHKEYPETLAALASPIDASDPFSGKALIYRRTSDGFLLYSVGFNGKDDGGSDDILNEKDDIVIRAGKRE
jgi:hypothetical protein